MSAVDDVRVEVAFDASPSLTAPSFRDLTSRARMDAGVSITRGRLDQYDQASPGSCTVTLDNDDAALTPGFTGRVLRTNESGNPMPATTTNWTAWVPLGIVVAPWDAARTAYQCRGNGAGLAYCFTAYGSRAWAIGETVTISATVRATAGIIARPRVHSRTGNVYFGPGAGPAAAVAGDIPMTGSPQRISVTATLTSASSTIDLAILFYAAGYTNALTTDVFEIGDVLIEAGPNAQDYFDGGTTDTAGIDYAWTGTAGSSSSTQSQVAQWSNVKAQNRIRVTYRDPAVDGNLLSANAASMETGTADWYSNTAFGTLTAAAISSSTTHPQVGTKGGLATWPTTALGSMAMTNLTGLVIGRTYTASAYVWVPAGSPNVWLDVLFLTAGATTATKGAMTRISVTFTATQRDHVIGVRCASATAGQQAWFDAVQVDEGTTVRTFTTTAPPIAYRFDGYVNEWPTEWPTGGDEQATATVTAYDLSTRISRARTLDSVITETYRLTDPLAYFPLDEPEGSLSAGDRAGAGSTLAVTSVGAGGTDTAIAFAQATGPATDGASSPQFTPTSVTNGKILYGTTPLRDNTSAGQGLAACFNTSTSANQTIAQWVDSYGSFIELAISAAGNLVATFTDTWTPGRNATITSAATFADGRTHTGTVTITNDGAGTVTIRLIGDGASLGTATYATAWPFVEYAFSSLYVGGRAEGRCYTGTISHVAAIGATVTLAQVQTQHTAVSTGFAGERTDQRIARVLSWVGIPTGVQALDVGLTTVAHVDSNGRDPWSYVADLATTEAGAVFISTSGAVTFHARTRMYDSSTAVTATVPADDVDPSTQIRNGIDFLLNDVTVTRPGGATIRARDAASVAEFGVFADSVEILAATDLDVQSRASWMVSEGAQPRPMLPQLGLDALTASATARALELGSRVAVTSMPQQAATATFDLRVQGYTEAISASGWNLAANATPFLSLPAFTLDDDAAGVLDSDYRLIY